MVKPKSKQKTAPAKSRSSAPRVTKPTSSRRREAQSSSSSKKSSAAQKPTSATREQKLKRPSKDTVSPEISLTVSGDSYERKKVTENNKRRQESEDKREIGKIPQPANPARREACRLDFDKFLRTYFPDDTKHPWSKVHVKLIETIQIVVLVGAMLAMGIPRGWAKTFLSVRAIIWAVAFRHHTMCMLIAASDAAAKELIQDIRDELETNELLQADFPEICLPIAALEGINQRAKGQTSAGVATKVKAADFELHLGDINGKPGAVIYAGGITGSRIRGRRKKRGKKIERPTLGLVDDFQTRRTARSKGECQVRLSIVSDDIQGLCGSNEGFSCLLTCTVIAPGDAADQLLDRTQHPDWRGIRASFLDSLPSTEALDLWDEWNRIRVEDLQAFDKDENDIEKETISERAHDYYRKHHKKMNAGAVVAWKYAYKPEHYVDALEKAMHWYFRSPRGFWSELQNQPDKFEVAALPQLLSHVLILRVHHCSRHMCPFGAEKIVVMGDVSNNVLWYEVRAFAMDSTSWSIDYGSWPKQNRAYFTQSTARETIDTMYSNLPTHEVRLMAAIRDLFNELFERQFQREDKAVLRLDIAGIDANDFTDEVREAIKKAGLAGKLWPMHSRSFRIPKPSLNELKKRDGDVPGDHWRRRKPETGSIRYVTYDTDRWKSHHRNRLLMPKNSPGSITWFRDGEHRMIADHHCVETSSNMTHDETGQKMEIWTHKPGVDNHLWDVGVGNDVLGSVLGCRMPAEMILTGQPTVQRKRKKRITVKF